MFRRLSFNALALRLVSMVSGVGRATRLFWYTRSKGPLVIVGVAGMVVAAFALLMHTIVAREAERADLTCLALNVYFEARGEPPAGQYAVAEVTMNRVVSGRYPDTVCGVVYQKSWDTIRKRYVGAFSWTDMARKPMPEGEAWGRAWKIAEEVYAEPREPMLDGALLYHATYVTPSWSREVTPVARIGRHIFYK